MDSPSQKNFIMKYNINNKLLDEICFLENSAFHAVEVDGIFFISTVPEPSNINNTNYVYIYASLDGCNWKVIYKFKKDFLPSSLQHITRYPEVEICTGNNLSPFIFAYGRSIKKFSNSMIIWDKKNIRKFLNE